MKLNAYIVVGSFLIVVGFFPSAAMVILSGAPQSTDIKLFVTATGNQTSWSSTDPSVDLSVGSTFADPFDGCKGTGSVSISANAPVNTDLSAVLTIDEPSNVIGIARFTQAQTTETQTISFNYVGSVPAKNHTATVVITPSGGSGSIWGSLSITVPTVSTSLYLSARTSGPFDNLDPYYYGVPSGYTLSINGTQGQTVYVAGLLYSPSESRCVPNQRIYLAIGNTTYAATTNDRGVAFWAVPLNVTSTLVSGYYGDYYALNVITEYYIPSTSGNVVVTIPGTVPQQTYLPTSQPQNDTVPPPVQSQEGGTETPETNGEAATSTFTYTLPTTAQVQQELAKYNIPIGAILITAGVGSIATGIIQERRKPNNS